MPKILILSAGFGNGHNAAAFNLRDGLEQTSEDVQVEVLDLFKICYGKTNDLVKKSFSGSWSMPLGCGVVCIPSWIARRSLKNIWAVSAS
jgi:hypothetical protein